MKSPFEIDNQYREIAERDHGNISALKTKRFAWFRWFRQETNKRLRQMKFSAQNSAVTMNWPSQFRHFYSVNAVFMLFWKWISVCLLRSKYCRRLSHSISVSGVCWFFPRMTEWKQTCSLHYYLSSNMNWNRMPCKVNTKSKWLSLKQKLIDARTFRSLALLCVCVRRYIGENDMIQIWKNIWVNIMQHAQ